MPAAGVRKRTSPNSCAPTSEGVGSSCAATMLAVRPARQPNLQHAYGTVKSLNIMSHPRSVMNVLTGPPPPGPAKIPQGHAGRAISWVHQHWLPVDGVKYPGAMHETPTSRCAAHRDNATMRCKHCNEEISFQPIARFKTHLVLHCGGFRFSIFWESKEVQDELALMESKQRAVRVSSIPRGCWFVLSLIHLP